MMYHVALRPALIAIGLFLLALFISVWMAFFTYRQNSETVFAEFDARADSLAAQISRELDITVATIEASASALSLGGSVDGSVLKEQLYTYLEKGNILASSPAIKNIGLVMNGGFKDASTPSPSFPLIGVYPDTSSKAIGADLSFSPERIAAIHFAQDTGRAGVGDRIVLLTGVPGVFFAFPIYATEIIPVVSGARRKETVGLIVAVLATDSFMLNALSDIDLKGVDFEVHDLGSDTNASPVLGAQTVLASSRLEAIDYSDSSSDELLISSASDVITRDVEVGGHVWRILLAPKPNATNSLAVQVSWAIALVGLLISALVGFATYQQLIQSVSLKRRVQERTHALQTANSLISKRANEDDLTGLGNRRSLANAIDQMIEEHAAVELYSIAAIHIDLDRFKQINDTMGHAGGDFVLRHVAKLITSSFPDEAFCARVGGDEFTAALIIENGNEIALQDAAYGLIEACSLPVAFEGRTCRFGASVGIAVQSLPEADPRALLVDADLALYRAKEDGRGRVQLFSPEIHAQVIAYKHRSDDILRAIEAGNEFIPYLQPQISFSDGQLYGVEALARWKHPELGVLPPSEFLSIAEDLDVVAQIDRSILEGSIDIVNRCQELGYSVPHLSTNLSFSRLMEEEFVASISNLPACDSSISFEILESIFLDEETGPAMWNIDKIRSAGFDVQIDDFGSGRASVVALTRVAPSRMKIDRELVAPIADHDERLQLVKSIVEIGKVLGIGVTAEGVETQKQAQLLGEMGCDVLQGYLFAKPLSEGDLLKFLRSFPISGKLAS